MDNCNKSGLPEYFHINISYSEQDSNIICIIEYPGIEWKPFSDLDDAVAVMDETLGYRLLKKRAKSLSFNYDAGINRLNIKL